MTNKGRRKAKESAFREYFSHIGELRSFFPDVSVLALTATASNLLQSSIKDSLAIPCCKVINVCPNKDNIRYSVLKVQRDIPTTLYWMVDKLMDEEEHFPRTLVYCTSIAHAANLYDYFKREYPKSVLYTTMYHSETDDVVKDYALGEMRKITNSTLRIIFCTSALGMGIDMKKFNCVIHYGPSVDLESYIQESGRIGRDGTPSHAVMLYHGGMLRDCCPKMRKFIKNTSVCRRLALFSEFASTIDIDKFKNKPLHHSCCDICENDSKYIEKVLIHNQVTGRTSNNDLLQIYSHLISQL